MSRGTRGFTLIELLVVIAIIGVLVAIIFPVYSKTKASAKQSVCVSNMRQLGSAVMQYTQDWDDVYPFAGNYELAWVREIYPYVNNKQVYRCPDCRVPSPSDPPISYLINDMPDLAPGGMVRFGALGVLGGLPMSAVSAPSDKIYLVDTTFSIRNWSGDWYYDCSFSGLGQPATGQIWTTNEVLQFMAVPKYEFSPHNGGGNYLYMDGHVKWSKPTTTLVEQFRIFSD